MPEFAEVYTIVKDLQSLVGLKIVNFESLGSPRYPALELNNYTLVGITQEAKYIIFEIIKAGKTKFLHLHLGMTGELGLNRKLENNLKSVITFHDGSQLFIRDYRGFGKIELRDNINYTSIPQIFDINFINHAMDNFSGRNRTIYSILIDQKLAPGVGSYLAQESLFMAKINPAKVGLTLDESKNLALQLRKLVKRAIKANGATMNNYRRIDGSIGLFQRQFKVYGLKDARCKKCKLGIICKIKIIGRSVYYCPICQD